MARTEVYLREWGNPGAGDGEFNVVVSVAVDGGEVYVTDFRNQRVQVFDRHGATCASGAVPAREMGSSASPGRVGVGRPVLPYTKTRYT
jgi:hypothetical protein